MEEFFDNAAMLYIEYCLHKGEQNHFLSGSTPCQRQCCGPGREFSMSITDNTQREVSMAHKIDGLNCEGAT